MNPTNMLELQMVVLENVSENKVLFEKELRKSFIWLDQDELQRLYFWALEKFNASYRSLIKYVFSGKYSDEFLHM